MLTPETDIEDRIPIWDCLQDLFMDTDADDNYQHISTICARSKYSIKELHDILFQEVLPALRHNLFALPAPEWRGFELSGLVELILEKHRFGQRKPWISRSYTQHHWNELKPLIERIKATHDNG